MTDITPEAVEAAITLLGMSWGDRANNRKSKAIIIKLVRAQAKRITELEANNNRQAQIITEFHKLSDDPADVLRVNQSTIITALSDRDKRIAELEAALFTIWGETKDLDTREFAKQFIPTPPKG